MPSSTVCNPAINRVINIKGKIKYLLLRGYSEHAQFLFLTHYYRLLWTKFNVFLHSSIGCKVFMHNLPIGNQIRDCASPALAPNS